MPRIDRRAIYDRDAGICGICGSPVPFADMDLDHIVHRWQGGPSVPSNLRASHKGCNRSRGRHDAIPESGPILNFVIDDDLLRNLDDFRYEHRFPSRAAAVKWLLNEALRRRFHPSSDEVRSEKPKP